MKKCSDSLLFEFWMKKDLMRPNRPQSLRSQRIWHDWASKQAWAQIGTSALFSETFEEQIFLEREYMCMYICIWASLVAQWSRICLQWRRRRFNPWIRKIPWRRKWQPTPLFLPGKSHGQRNLAGYSPWGCKESDTIYWLNNNNNICFVYV